MKKIVLASLALAPLYTAMPAWADDQEEQPVLSQPGPADDMLFERLHPEAPVKAKIYPKIDLKVTGIEDGKPIPDKFAYCNPGPDGKTVNGANISPAVHWLNPPAAAKSFVLFVVDPDVPADFTDANKDGKEIPVKAPRQDFYHWVLVDIPPASLGLFEGADSRSITPGGKPVGQKAFGVDGKNDYSKIYPGAFGGYDGPCPPWNDLRLHHYHFVLYGLDIPRVGLPNPITPLQVQSVMEGHIIAKGEVTGTYSTNPRWVAAAKKVIEADPEMVPGEKFKPDAN